MVNCVRHRFRQFSHPLRDATPHGFAAFYLYCNMDPIWGGHCLSVANRPLEYQV